MSKELSHIARMVEQGREIEMLKSNRRLWLQNMAAVAGTGALMWACGKDDDDADAVTATANPKVDGDYLNVALGLEHEAIGIYTVAAGLDPFTKVDSYAALLGIAASFLDHHKAHRDALIAALKDLKTQDATVADPVASKTSDEYIAGLKTSYGDTIVALLSGASTDGYKAGVTNILRVAADKEMAASKAYLSLVSKFTSKLTDGSLLSDVDGALAVEEAAHYGVLRAGLFAVLGDTTSVSEAKFVVPGALPGSWTAQAKPA
jgi:hypothetical protein